MYKGYMLKQDETFVTKDIFIPIPKNCGKCAKPWSIIPAIAVNTEVGYWWNCECGSTVFIMHKKEKVAA